MQTGLPHRLEISIHLHAMVSASCCRMSNNFELCQCLIIKFTKVGRVTVLRIVQPCPTFLQICLVALSFYLDHWQSFCFIYLFGCR